MCVVGDNTDVASEMSEILQMQSHSIVSSEDDTCCTQLS